MESEFPDNEDEFEFQYMDELELANEIGNNEGSQLLKPNVSKTKRSLSFSIDNCVNQDSRADINLSPQGDISRKRSREFMFSSSSVDDETDGKEKVSCKRSRNEGKYSNSANDLSDSLSLSKTGKKSSISKTITEKPYQSITTNIGQLYVEICSSEDLQEKRKRLLSRKSEQLLSIPIQELKNDIKSETRIKTTVIEDKAFEKRLQELEMLSWKEKAGCTIPGQFQNNETWVEKYRPNCYAELLSDETVNRTLLHWLKLWDKIVFNKEFKAKYPPREEKSKLHPNTNSYLEARKSEKFKGKKNIEVGVVDEFDNLGRPLQKIALISGSPGLGKTTLAHVIAKHAGYNVVEMNASDDRNPDAFKLMLESATQMRSVLSGEDKPNCLVIDEIDGAPQASINYLVAAVQGQEKGTDNPNNKRRKRSTEVLRPIICICNDLYTPALRPLRQVAVVIQLPSSLSGRLAQRLMEIARLHEMKTDMSVLLALCEKANYDIRSCLTTLYFFKNRTKQLRYIDVVKSNIGQKDLHRSLFQVWQDIFHIPRPKRQNFNGSCRQERTLPLAPDVSRPLDPNMGNTATNTARFANILQTVQLCGDYEKLMQGVFENCLNITFRGNCMDTVCTGLEWMCYYDILNCDIQHSQNYSMLPYVPYIFIALHFQYAAVSAQRLKFPNMTTGATNECQNVVHTIVQGVGTAIRRVICKELVVHDLNPYLLNIITPTLRPVSAHLYTTNEKELIQHIVDVMISYNLTYRQEKTLDGAYRFVLDPDIEILSLMKTNGHRRQLCYTVKQMIAREIELEKMRRYENSCQRIFHESVDKKPAKEPKSEAPVSSSVRTSECKAVTMFNKQSARDFFGRSITSTWKRKNLLGSSDLLQSDIWFHFKEGYTNAVRRNVKMLDFL